MDDLSRRVDALSARLRLQTLVTFGALAVLVFATGGADVVAKSLVAVDGWTVRTRNAGGVLTDRLNVTTDLDKTDFQVKNSNVVLQNANLFLEKQLTEPFAPAPANEGALWYDDTANQLKVSNGSTWSGAGGGMTFIQKITVVGAQNSVTFSGLNGDVDGTYFITARIKSASANNNDQYRIRPNGILDTVTQSSRIWVMSNTSTFALNSGTGMILNRTGGSALGTTFQFSIHFNAKTGNPRLCLAEHARVTGATAEGGGTASVWTNTTTNITSLQIEAFHASGITTGSEFILYKLSQS